MQAQNVSPNKRRKIVILLVAFLILGFGLSSLISGAVIAALNQTVIESEGFSLSEVYEVSTSSYALVVGFIPYNRNSSTAISEWVVTSTNTSKTLFVGWAWINDTFAYLHDVQFVMPPNWDWDYGPYWSTLNIPSTTTLNGTKAPSIPPSNESFWIASAQSNETMTIPFSFSWDPSLGNKSLVIMNADGSPNVQAELQFASKMPMFEWLPLVLIPVGLILVVVGTVVFRLRKRFYLPKTSPSQL